MGESREGVEKSDGLGETMFGPQLARLLESGVRLAHLPLENADQVSAAMAAEPLADPGRTAALEARLGKGMTALGAELAFLRRHGAAFRAPRSHGREVRFQFRMIRGVCAARR